MAIEVTQYGSTQLRNALTVLLDLQVGGGLVLTPWQDNLARMKSTQAHYSDRERSAIIRLVVACQQSGALERALEARRNANSPQNHERIKKCCNSHAGHGSSGSGGFWCVICNTGARVHYHIGRGTLAAVCENRTCVRLISGPEDIARKPRFANIIPHDVGTFLVESETNPGVFYGVDVVEQTCTCEAFKFHPEETCKHLKESSYAVFEMHHF